MGRIAKAIPTNQHACVYCVNFDTAVERRYNNTDYVCALKGCFVKREGTCYCWAADRKRTQRERVELIDWQQANKKEPLENMKYAEPRER